MKQIYHPYWKWECYKNGMWRKETREYEEKNLPDVIKFTGNHTEYGLAMMEAAKNWKITCEHHLTDAGLNHRAFIGHAGCCYKFGWPEYLVRQAWGFLNEEQQMLANLEADKAVNHFLSKRTTHAKTLFG